MSEKFIFDVLEYDPYDTVTETADMNAYGIDCGRIHDRIMSSVRENSADNTHHRGKKRRRFVPMLVGAAVILAATAAIGSVIVLGQADVEKYRQEAHQEYVSAFRQYSEQFSEEGLPEYGEDSPYYKMTASEISDALAKQAIIDKIAASINYGGTGSTVDINDREAYYNFISECCRQYKESSLSPEDKGRILWLIIQDYYSVKGRSIKGDEYYMGYHTTVDLDSIKPQRDAAIAAIDEIVAGVKSHDPLPNETYDSENVSQKTVEDQYKERWNEKKEECLVIIKQLVEEHKNQYRGIGPIIRGEEESNAAYAATQEMELETFAMVQSYGGAKGIDEPILSTNVYPTTKDPEKWKQHSAYLNDCYELFYSDRITDYERHCLYYVFLGTSFPEKLKDKEANEAMQKAKAQAKEVCDVYYSRYLNSFNYNNAGG